MLTTIDHVVIGVRDLDAAVSQYAALLGRRPSWRGEHPGSGTANVLFRLENTYLELLSPRDEASALPLLSQQLERDGDGLFALAFGTPDAAKCAEVLRGRGVSVASPSDGEGRELTRGTVRRWRNVVFPGVETRGLLLFAIEHLTESDALPEAEPLVESCVVGLDHVVVRTSDPGAAVDLYRDRLGIRLALDRSFEKRGVRLLFFRLGGTTLEFAAPLVAAGDDPGPDRFSGLAYRLPDLVAGRERVAAAGFDVSQVRKGNKPGTLVCTVRDGTHGVATLLIGPDPKAHASAA